jgi:hypothetical protein
MLIIVELYDNIMKSYLTTNKLYYKEIEREEGIEKQVYYYYYLLLFFLIIIQ